MKEVGWEIDNKPRTDSALDTSAMTVDQVGSDTTGEALVRPPVRILAVHLPKRTTPFASQTINCKRCGITRTLGVRPSAPADASAQRLERTVTRRSVYVKASLVRIVGTPLFLPNPGSSPRETFALSDLTDILTLSSRFSSYTSKSEDSVHNPSDKQQLSIPQALGAEHMKATGKGELQGLPFRTSETRWLA